MHIYTYVHTHSHMHYALCIMHVYKCIHTYRHTLTYTWVETRSGHPGDPGHVCPSQTNLTCLYISGSDSDCRLDHIHK